MTKHVRLALRLALTAGFTTMAVAPRALGQMNPLPPAAAPASALTPPRLITFIDAEYPAAAKAQGRGAGVDLEIMISAEGTVSAVKVVAPVGEGFDEAAEAAARGFVFEPARRGSQAIAAKIRYRYVFESKPAPLPETLVAAPASVPAEEIAAGDATLNAKANVTPAAAPLEFGATATIEAPPREVTKRSLKAEELLRVAGTRGDPLKAIEYMPGVARGDNGMVIVRGSSPADSEVQFEGAPVYNLYHFQGLSSFVNARMLERIDLYPGNFSTRYGRRLGSIIDVGVRDPKRTYHALADVNVIDSSILLEGPIGDRASIAIAAKRSNLDFFIKNALPDDMQLPAAPVYWDYQILAAYHPTDKDRIRAMIFGSYDDFKLIMKNTDSADPSVRGQFGARNDFHRAQLQWRHQYSDAVEHEINLSGGPFASKTVIGPEVFFDVPGRNAYLRSEWRARLHDRVRLMAGLDIQYLHFAANYFGPALEPIEGNPRAFDALATKKNVSFDREGGFTSPAAYAEMIIQATDQWTLVPGGRVDRMGSIERWTFDPRLTSRFELVPGSTLKGGVGLFSQEPDIGESLPLLGNPHLQAPRAQHFGFGGEQKLGERLMVSVEGFYKRLDKVVVASAVPGEHFGNGGIGRIWGAEMSARLQPNQRTTGFVSYTLSRSRRNDNGEGWRLFNWDQTHILTVAGSLRLGNGWDLSSTFRYTSGNPLTPVMGSSYNANNDLYRPIYGAVNSDRNPAFHRLDLRIEKAWRIGGGSLASYLDVQNVYNQKAQAGRAYDYDFRRSQVQPGLGLIPSIGLRGEL
jgi:TonB family protein